MKTKTFMKKLNLKRATVTNLENRAMDSVRGGLTAGTCFESCLPKCNTVFTCEGCPVLTDHSNTCRPCIP